jgi:hypothetical protein
MPESFGEYVKVKSGIKPTEGTDELPYAIEDRDGVIIAAFKDESVRDWFLGEINKKLISKICGI